MDAAGELSFGELILNASFLVQLVMAFLLALSVISWTIIIQRSSQYKNGRRKADEFEDKFWSGIDLNSLYQDCVKRQNDLTGLEVIYAAGFKEFVRLVNSGPADQDVVMDGTYRQMKVASSREVEALESSLPTLATIGSISPYIGLFDTVWGIMHAFVALAAVKNATLAMVAPPIAEALIATAMGLFAAIPAVMFYNRFVTKVEALENRYLNFMDEFATILNRRLVTIRSQLAKAEELKKQQTAAAQAESQVSAPRQQPVRDAAREPSTPAYAYGPAPSRREPPQRSDTGIAGLQRVEQGEDAPHYPPPGSSLSGLGIDPYRPVTPPRSQAPAHQLTSHQVFADYSAGQIKAQGEQQSKAPAFTPSAQSAAAARQSAAPSFARSSSGEFGAGLVQSGPIRQVSQAEASKTAAPSAAAQPQSHSAARPFAEPRPHYITPGAAVSKYKK